MLHKDIIDDNLTDISDSQFRQMERLKPLMKGVLYKFTADRDAPEAINFFRADVY